MIVPRDAAASIYGSWGKIVVDGLQFSLRQLVLSLFQKAHDERSRAVSADH